MLACFVSVEAAKLPGRKILTEGKDKVSGTVRVDTQVRGGEVSPITRMLYSAVRCGAVRKCGSVERVAEDDLQLRACCQPGCSPGSNGRYDAISAARTMGAARVPEEEVEVS